MNVLHISNKPVYPLIDGGCVAMSKMLINLTMIAQNAKHICINTPKHPFKKGDYPTEVNLPLSAEQTFIDTTPRPLPALMALVKGENYNLTRFYTEAVEAHLKSYLQQEAFDVIVLESLFLSGYIPAIRSVSDAKIIVRAHNVEHELWEQQARESKNILKKWYLNALAKSLKKAEIKQLNDADQIWTITQEDALKLAALGVTKPIHTIGVAIQSPSELVDYSKTDFFHLGSLNWPPNQLAVEVLTRNYWPKLSNRETSQLHIAGSFSQAVTIEAQKGVILHGYVENATQFMCEHGILVSPVRTGSGVRIKLLEALALGVPCITTTIGAMGIDRPEEVLILANSDEEWVNAMLQLSESQELRARFGQKAKRYMEKYHSFAAINTQIRHALEK